MPTIDLNADMGEGKGDDRALLAFVSSANIACGAHAGDLDTIRTTVRSAIEAGVSVGAHPGYDDPVNFGRREMHLSDERVVILLKTQLERIATIASQEGAVLGHVKPHGALYNQAAFDSSLSELIAETVHGFEPSLVLVGLAGSELVAAGRRAGLHVANEAFADRNYRGDGSLLPRSDPKALIASPEEAARRTIDMATTGRLKTVEGTVLTLEIDTICVHGDSPGALEMARSIRASLSEASIGLAPIAQAEQEGKGFQAEK